MKKSFVSLLLVGMFLGLTSLAAAQKAASTSQGEKPGAIVVDVVKMTATVKALDSEKRTVTLEGKGGKPLTVNAKNARNFDQIKVGDQVSLEYLEELAVYVRKADAPPDAKIERTVALAPKGKMPGGLMAETVEIQAAVKSINQKKRTLTLEGPAGGTRTIRVGKAVKNFKEVKKGDQVVVRITEALALDVSRP
jgi:hypothetical protein